MHIHLPNKPKKFNSRCLLARYLMATVFCSSKGVLMAEFMQQGTTVTSEVYWETLKKLRRAIQNKRRGKLISGVVLLRDNVRPRRSTSCSHSNIAGAFQLGVVWPPFVQPWSRSTWLQPVYLPEQLVDITALHNNELMEGVKTWLRSQGADFFDTCIQKRIPP
jgi:hypothetical protein